MMLAIIQQITGNQYGTVLRHRLFAEHAGASASQAIGMNILVGVVNLLFTVVGTLAIDKLGRRPLLLTATAGMGLCLVTFAGCSAICLAIPLCYSSPCWDMWPALHSVLAPACGFVLRSCFQTAFEDAPCPSDNGALDLRLNCDRDVPEPDQEVLRLRSVSRICSDLRRLIPLHLSSAPGDQEPHPGGNRGHVGRPKTLIRTPHNKHFWKRTNWSSSSSNILWLVIAPALINLCGNPFVSAITPLEALADATHKCGAPPQRIH